MLFLNAFSISIIGRSPKKTLGNLRKVAIVKIYEYKGKKEAKEKETLEHLGRPQKTLEDLRRPQETLKDLRRPWKTSEDLGRLYNASDNFGITWKILYLIDR